LAEELNIPQITYVLKFRLEKDDKVIVERAFRTEEVIEIETKLPVLVSVVKEINDPRMPGVQGIVNAYQNKEVFYLNADDIGADKSEIGLNGSMTEVWKIFIPKKKVDHIVLTGTNEEMVRELCNNLHDDKVI